MADSEGRAEEVEKKKQENLSKQKEGKGHWEEQLASDSESAVCDLPTSQSVCDSHECMLTIPPGQGGSKRKRHQHQGTDPEASRGG
jgi:hypothetical protein